jgi:hypothetical protein
MVEQPIVYCSETRCDCLRRGAVQMLDSRSRTREKALGEILGRVVHAIPEQRGADVLYELQLPRDWLAHGAAIAVDLPHQLACASCSGGGCDACGRTGAVTLRSRDASSEPLVVRLPCRPVAEQHVGVVLRIPDRGGLPAPDHPGPRGLLLLRIHAVDGAASDRVALVEEGLGAGGPSAFPRVSRTAGLLLVACLVLTVLAMVWGL